MAQQNPPIKNASFVVGPFPIYDSLGALVSGAAISSAQVSKDGAAYAACSNAVAEVPAASGTYVLTLTAAEFNADLVAVKIATALYGTYVFNVNTTSDPAAALLDLANGVEAGVTVRQAMRLVLAALAGKLSGAATTSVTVRNVGDTKNRIVATVDADGNRTAVTTDGT